MYVRGKRASLWMLQNFKNHCSLRFFAELDPERASDPPQPEPPGRPRSWVAAWNENPKPFIWTKTAERPSRFSSQSHDFLNGLTVQDTSTSLGSTTSPTANTPSSPICS